MAQNAGTDPPKSASEKWSQLYEDLLPPHANDAAIQRELFECSKGGYRPLWYNFKRFESLTLLNLYHYQHEIAVLEATINSARPRSSKANAELLGIGVMTGQQIQRMRRLLKEYHKAILLFKEISLVDRPSMEARQETARILKEKLKEDHYTEAADAYGMLTLAPASLGVEADGIRIFMSNLRTKIKSRRWSTYGAVALRSTAFMPKMITDAARDRSSESDFLKTPEEVRCMHNSLRTFDNQPDGASHHDLDGIDLESGVSQSETDKALHLQTTIGPTPDTTDEGVSFAVRSPERTEQSAEAKRQIMLFAGRPYQVQITKGVDTVARLALSMMAALFLLAPMFALSYIPSKGYQLMTTSFFVIVFAAMLSLSTKASNQELMLAVAGYLAVLVVFIGQSIGNQ